MDDTELKLRKKISYAIANRKSISFEELKEIHDEALNFATSLPLNEGSVFLWTSGMECLGMLVSAIERIHNKNQGD